LPAVALDLARSAIPLRAHARVAEAWKQLRLLCPNLPALTRFSGKLAKGEVLLWPPEAHDAVALRELPNPRLALVSGLAASPDVLFRMRLQHGFALTTMPNFAEILSAVEASGAREVALCRGSAEAVAKHLRERGFFAYALEPPRQMALLGL
jgi:hypothetical protein